MITVDIDAYRRCLLADKVYFILFVCETPAQEHNNFLFYFFIPKMSMHHSDLVCRVSLQAMSPSWSAFLADDVLFKRNNSIKYWAAF